jgi:hypothetical protein
MKFDKLVEECLEEYSGEYTNENFGSDLTNSFMQGVMQGVMKDPQIRDVLFKFLIGQIHPEMAFTVRYAIYLAVSALIGGHAAVGIYKAYGELFHGIIDATKKWVLKKLGKTIKSEDTVIALKQARRLLEGPNAVRAQQLMDKLIDTSKANDIEGFKKVTEELKGLVSK